jgi:hypothetical protein
MQGDHPDILDRRALSEPHSSARDPELILFTEIEVQT